LNIFIKGKNKVSLTQKELLAQGGEGAVYVKGGTAFKIYFDQCKCIPVGKIQELSAITHKDIIKPEDILLDDKGNQIGYTMRYVSDTVALCKIFTKAFKNRYNISPQITLDLVRKLQELVVHCHSKNILIVDLNELNFLLSEKLDEIYGIDVDSYQTKSFPATAIMENIRDRQVKNNQFTEGSDWFSFAVIAFNMMIGIHPYKGKHPSIRDWSERMDKNISVFDSSVSIPNVCLPLDVIPDNYLQWFKAVLSQGKRLAPPTGLHDIINLVTQIKKIIGSNNFDINEIFSAKSEIRYCLWGDTHLVLTKSHGANINGKEVPEVPADASVVILPQRNIALAASLECGKIKLFNATTRSPINFDVAGVDLMQSDNRLYVKNGAAVYEIKFLEVGVNIIPSLQQVAQCLELGSKLYDGVMIQSLLGATYVSFFPEADKHYQLHIKELDQYRVIDAKYEKKVLIVIGYKNGKYDKLIFRLSSTFEEYDIRIVTDVQYSGINFTVLDNKICIHITEEEKMELFPAVRNQSQIKEIEDPVLSGDMKLFSHGVQAFFSKGDKIYTIKVK